MSGDKIYRFVGFLTLGVFLACMGLLAGLAIYGPASVNAGKPWNCHLQCWSGGTVKVNIKTAVENPGGRCYCSQGSCMVGEARYQTAGGPCLLERRE